MNKISSTATVSVFAAIVFVFPAHCQEQAKSYAGNIPEGFWVLNATRSQKLTPGTQTLWIIKDDGTHLVFVSVETDPEHRVRVLSWDGAYDGKPVEMTGSGMMTQLTAPTPGTLHNHGVMPQLGSYTEDCSVKAEGKQLRCEGEVTTPQGKRKYVDDFDWYAQSPVASVMK